MTAAAASPVPDPTPVLTRKLQMLAETLPHLHTELLTKEKP